MSSIKQIKEMLSTDDINVVRLCQQFVDERADLERMRGEAAERRANIILSTLGASSAFLVFVASNLLGDPERAGWLVIVLYAASVLWVSRSVWYCIKSLRTQSRYRVTEESVFEVQEKTEIEAAKSLLSGKIWELQRSVQPNTERLFYVQRAQRSLVIFVGIVLMIGFSVSLYSYYSIELDPCFIFLVIVVFFLLWLFGDRLVEINGIWKHGQ